MNAGLGLDQKYVTDNKRASFFFLIYRFDEHMKKSFHFLKIIPFS